MKLLRIALVCAIPFSPLLSACDRSSPTPPTHYTFDVTGSSGPLYQPPGRKPTVPVTELDNSYTATPERKTSIIDNVPKLKAAMTRQNVRNILGPPDQDRATSTNSLSPRLNGYHLTYTLHTASLLGANLHDSLVSVSFDDQDHLQQWWSENVPELAGTIGQPAAMARPETTASPARRARIVAGLTQLNRSMTGAQVTALLGAPDSVWHLAKADDATRCDYPFYKAVGPGSYHFDGEIFLYLDAQEHPLRWEAQNVPELPTNGASVKAAPTTGTLQ